jgi:periplasmic divalent cation tolerance protein
MNKYCLVKTTFKTKKSAEKMAEILLRKKLVACAQISRIESFYNWEDKILGEKEFLLTAKTKTSFYKKVEKKILENHPYQTPQIISVPILSGSKAYFDWLEDCLKNK